MPEKDQGDGGQEPARRSDAGDGGPRREDGPPRRETRWEPVFRGRRRGDDGDREGGAPPSPERSSAGSEPAARPGGTPEAGREPGAREPGARQPLGREPGERESGPRPFAGRPGEGRESRPREFGGREGGSRDFSARDRSFGSRDFGGPRREGPPREGPPREGPPREGPPREPGMRREGGDRPFPPRRDAGERPGFGPRREGGEREGFRPPSDRDDRPRDGGDRGGFRREGFDRDAGARREGAPRSFGPRRDQPEGRSFGPRRDAGDAGERRPRFDRPERPRDDGPRREGGPRSFGPRRDSGSGGDRPGDDRGARGGRAPMYMPSRAGSFRSKYQRGDQARIGPKKKKKVRVYFHQALTRILLPKLLTKAKYLSPMLARQFIESGRVRVNARIVSSRYYEVNLRKERVTIDEAPTEYPRRLSYYIYNKPAGVVCETSDPQFAALFDATSQWCFPFGRLSKPVSGLVILSNDPRMLRRQHMLDVELQKEYRIRINKHLTDEEIDTVRQGVLVGDEYFVPLRVTPGERNTHSMWMDITLLDDSYHHIYTALKKVGAEVVRMRRMRIGLLNESMVPTREWRELSGFEITGLALQRFMPGELPPEPFAPPRPRMEKPGGKFSRDQRGGPRRPGGSGGGWADRRFDGKKPPFSRRRDDDDDPEERQRREELADSIGNR